MSSRIHDFDMAETLIVLAGANACAAAEGIADRYAEKGDLAAAHRWLDVALAVTAVWSGGRPGDAPGPAPAESGPPGESRDVIAVSASSAAATFMAPIPLRARRHSTWRAMLNAATGVTFDDGKRDSGAGDPRMAQAA